MITKLQVVLTERAGEQVRALLARDETTTGYGLRVGAEPGGCSGYKYSLALAPAAEKGDITVRQDGFDVFVASESASLVHGVRIDYAESLTSSGFVFSNPRAADPCSCGSSFSADSADSAERQEGDEDTLWRQVDEAIQQVRPFLQRDGGDVTVVDITAGVVSVRLTGACGGCSAALDTLTGVIERQLKESVPAVERVVLAY
ncbi:iron-sulfur cluster assembly accessory protein [Protofrankia coriariae]|uniref:Heme biosynthesis protein HemY n=1 Tax=Protofrankia coriariae TaxID=1562887 RepID=A0ABR5F759_9ACTN|nr:iron-sulfur cluster assembly accessory protein [Protofrankia coriariae]KLL12502.1 heme biosynthesis protein HemY [Protofrankia coriariae]